MSIIPQGAIRTRVGHASVTWATCNKLTHLITLTLTSSVLDAEGRIFGGRGLAWAQEPPPEPLMSLKLFSTATVHAGSMLWFWCAHSSIADLTMASCYESLPSFIYSRRWCEIWSENRHLLLTYLFSLWTIIDCGSTLALLHILQTGDWGKNQSIW